MEVKNKMSKVEIEKKSSENKYLHLDFHITCDMGLQYLAKNFGEESVVEYIELVAQRYYSPLTRAIHQDGLKAIEVYLQKIYSIEEAAETLFTKLEGDTLFVHLDWCPAVRYVTSKGHEMSKYYRATTEVLYRAIAENAGISFSLDAYDERSGAADFRFIDA